MTRISPQVESKAGVGDVRGPMGQQLPQEVADEETEPAPQKESPSPPPAPTPCCHKEARMPLTGEPGVMVTLRPLEQRKCWSFSPTCTLIPRDLPLMFLHLFFHRVAGSFLDLPSCTPSAPCTLILPRALWTLPPGPAITGQNLGSGLRSGWPCPAPCTATQTHRRPWLQHWPEGQKPQVGSAVASVASRRHPAGHVGCGGRWPRCNVRAASRCGSATRKVSSKSLDISL